MAAGRRPDVRVRAYFKAQLSSVSHRVGSETAPSMKPISGFGVSVVVVSKTEVSEKPLPCIKFRVAAHDFITGAAHHDSGLTSGIGRPRLRILAEA